MESKLYKMVDVVDFVSEKTNHTPEGILSKIMRIDIEKPQKPSFMEHGFDFGKIRAMDNGSGRPSEMDIALFRSEKTGISLEGALMSQNMPKVGSGQIRMIEPLIF
jgi:hypothetical protein